MFNPARRDRLVTEHYSSFFLLAVSVLTVGAIWTGQHLIWTGDGTSYLYLLMLVQATPFLFCFARQRFNYIAFVLFNHLMCYSVPKLNQMLVIYKVDTLFPEAVFAIQQLTICTILMTIFYYFFRYFFFYSFVEKEKYQMLSLTRFQLIFVAGYVIAVPALINYIPPLLLTVHFAAVAADMVLLLCANSPGNEVLASILRTGVYISAFWYFIKTGALTMVGNLAGYIVIAACLRRDYRMLVIPIILTVVGSTVQTVKNSYRVAITTNSRLTIGERVEVIGGLLYNEYVEKEKDLQIANEDVDQDESDNVENMLHGFSRLGDDSLERVLAWTPNKVPFWEGETYASILYMFVPRFIWNDKPSRHIWNRFGRAYGYLSEEDYQTSVAVNYFAEAYMNYGYTGLYLCAVVMGLVVAAAERLSYYFLKGYFYFTFMAFLMPVMSYATDFTSIVQSITIVGATLILFRPQFVRMARKDDYS